MSKLSDYEKTLKVIRSCVTNQQNQTAYRMIWNFQTMYQDDNYSNELFRECDNILVDIIQGRRR